MPRRLCLLLIGISFGISLSAQRVLRLQLLPVDREPAFLDGPLKYPTRFADSLQMFHTLQDILQQLRQASYLEASIDTLVRTDSLHVALIHVGPAYQWLALTNGNLDEEALRQAGFREKLFSKRPLRWERIQELQENLLQYAENNGYPFASVWLDSVQISPEGKVSAQLFSDKGAFYTFGELKLPNDPNIATNYLQQYLGLQTGRPYDRSELLNARERIRSLPFVAMERDPLVEFMAGTAQVNLFLQEKKASRFDFLIGVLPNSTTTGRMLITGNFKGEFYNQFQRGERIYANFEQLRPETQRLDLEFNYPYLLGLPFGLDLNFNLYKRDTTFLDLNYDLGIQYLLPGGSYLKAFWNNQRSRLLAINEARLQSTRTLPSELDLNVNHFGLAYRRQRLDYRLNPRQGWDVLLQGSAGIKKIIRNNKIEALELSSLYDSLTLRSSQYQIEIDAARYWPLFSRSTLKTAVRGGYKISNNPIYRNEQYRLGGNQLLRGFDEEFFFATRYTIGTLEYRFLIGTNAYLFLFGDYGYLEDLTTARPTVQHPYGFGAGITFETPVGLFGLSLAFGGLENTPVDLGAPKVHFGYISLF